MIPEQMDHILKEMRGNEFDDPHLNGDGIIGARILAKGWADRIELSLKSLFETMEMQALEINRLRCSISGCHTREMLCRKLLNNIANDSADALAVMLDTGVPNVP